ncbi:MAG: hypothetical protein ACLQVD_12590 [Capsulimonadaceae bacterium]
MLTFRPTCRRLPLLFALCSVIAAAAGCSAVQEAIQNVQITADSRKDLVEAMRYPTYAARVAAARQKGLPTTLSDIFAVPTSGPNAAPLFQQMESMPPDNLENSVNFAIFRPKQPTASESDWASAETYLHRDASLVSLAEKAASIPNCVFPRVDTGQDPATVVFPEYAQMRRAARIIALKSVLMARDSRPVEAVREQALGFQTSRDAYRDVGLIGWLGGLSDDEITLKGMQQILIASHGDPTAAADVEASIDKDWTPAPLSDGLKQELAFGNSEIMYIGKHGPPALAATENSSILSCHNARSLPYSGRIWQAIIDANGSRFINLMRQNIDASRLPYPVSQTAMDAITQDFLTPHKSLAYVIVDILTPVASKCPTRAATVHAEADITRCAAAVFVWRGRHHTYPVTLSEAMPSVPVDPFDGKPMKYRLEAGGFVIYSVGETGKYMGEIITDRQRYEEAFRYP